MNVSSLYNIVILCSNTLTSIFWCFLQCFPRRLAKLISVGSAEQFDPSGVAQHQGSANHKSMHLTVGCRPHAVRLGLFLARSILF